MELKINIVEASSRSQPDGEAKTWSGMEAVHHADARPWIGPEIRLSKHFERFADLVRETRGFKPFAKVDAGKTATNRRIRQLMELSGQMPLTDSLFDEISTNCNPDNFSLKKEVEAQQQFTEIQGKYPKYVPCNIPPSGVKTLKTLELQQAFLAKTTEKERFKRMRSLRMPNNAHFEAAPPLPTRINPDLTHSEVLVAIRVYRPIKASTRNIASAMTTSNKCVQEIYALGSNKLSQVRDLIKCPGDYMIPGDLSQDAKDRTALEKAPRNSYKSAFFFIGDTFYNDMRFPGCHDFSQGIREWAIETKRNLGRFATKKMEDTSIKDLTLRPGYPYVYVHQGDHEHLISFVEARLVSADDVQKPMSYPFERSVGMVHSKMCMACNTFIAKWITTQNERVPEEPFFFCEECFRQFNYGPKNEKLGNFKAFSYIDVNAL